MNQNRCTRDKTQGEPCPPSYQAEVFNPFVGQPAPPGHSHADGPSALRSPPAGPKRSGGGRGSGYSCAACGGAGWGRRGSKTEWKPGGRHRASPGGVHAPEPGLPGAAAPARAGSALPTPRLPPCAPSARSPAPAAPAARGCTVALAPLSGGEPVVVAAAVQDVPSWELGGVLRSPAGPAHYRKTKMWRMVLTLKTGTLAYLSYTHN